MKIVTTIIVGIIILLLFAIHNIRDETSGIYVGVFFALGYFILPLIGLLGILYAIRDWSVLVRFLFVVFYLGLVISPLLFRG